MPRNVNGEFEILLGNKQLLSVFFIVLMLMAVFFTMGYVLGRDSASRAAVARSPAPSPAPAAQTPAADFAGVPSDASPAAAAAEDIPTKSAGTQPQSQEPGKAAPAAARPPAQSSAKPAPGEVYLQAIAGNRADAEIVANVLRKKGFPIVLAPGPTEGVLRVLVGPIEDDQTLRKMRAGLEAAGVKPFTRRY
ncbi:MAG: SPOR domain-containing protein [Bryobacterales bacterium]|nr:SPOR domain-containing protein [Bryobacterales bacterium]